MGICWKASVALGVITAGLNLASIDALHSEAGEGHAMSEILSSGGAIVESLSPKMASGLKGKQAPAFILTDLDGHKVSLLSFRGNPIVVNFWATWCGPCKLEMPWFEEFHTKYANVGLVVLGVAADNAGKPIIASVVHKLGITYPILIADSTVEKAYGGMDALPKRPKR